MIGRFAPGAKDVEAMPGFSPSASPSWVRRVRAWLKDRELRPGIARGLRKHVTILEREIAALEASG
jgi:hypothetical protein